MKELNLLITFDDNENGFYYIENNEIKIFESDIASRVHDYFYNMNDNYYEGNRISHIAETKDLFLKFDLELKHITLMNKGYLVDSIEASKQLYTYELAACIAESQRKNRLNAKSFAVIGKDNRPNGVLQLSDSNLLGQICITKNSVKIYWRIASGENISFPVAVSLIKQTHSVEEIVTQLEKVFSANEYLDAISKFDDYFDSSLKF